MKDRTSEYIQIITRQLFRTALLAAAFQQADMLNMGTVWFCFLLGFFTEFNNFIKE